jgi:opacity protein-like surface antigen
MIKNTFFLAALLLFVNANSLKAQELTNAIPDYEHKIELTPIVGFMLSGSINFYNGKIKFDDNVNYGGALAFNAGYGTFIEASYTFTSTNSRLTSYYYDIESKSFTTNINYIQLSGLKEFKDGQIRPFAMLGVGASGFVPQEAGYESWWSFAMNFGGGVKINLTENIGIRLQARLLMPLYLNGIGIFCGTGGCGSGATLSSTVIQGDFSGGLVFGIR